jgi:hypothetical protein
VSAPLNINGRESNFEKFISRIKWKRRKARNHAFVRSTKTFQNKSWCAPTDIIVPHINELDESSTSELIDKSNGQGSMSHKFVQSNVSISSSITDVVRISPEIPSKRHSSYISHHCDIFNLKSVKMEGLKTKKNKMCPKSLSVENGGDGLLSPIPLGSTPISNLMTPVNRHAVNYIQNPAGDGDNRAYAGESLSLNDFKLDDTESRLETENQQATSNIFCG